MKYVDTYETSFGSVMLGPHLAGYMRAARRLTVKPRYLPRWVDRVFNSWRYALADRAWQKTHAMEDQIEDMWREGRDAFYAEMGADGEIAVFDESEIAAYQKRITFPKRITFLGPI